MTVSGEDLPTTDERLAHVEGRLTQIEWTYERRWLRMIPYVVLAIGMGVALWLVSTRASEESLSSERTARLTQDCQGRVEGRDVLRIVIIEAYTPPLGASDSAAVAIEARRDALLDRVPPLKCVTKTGIPTAVPDTEPR